MIDRHFIEDNALAVGRPFGRACKRTSGRDAAQVLAIGLDDIDTGGLHMLPAFGMSFEFGVTVGRECDPLAVGRPTGMEVTARAKDRGAGGPGVGEISKLFGFEIEQPNVGGTGASRGDKRDVIAVGREGRLIVIRGIVGETLETGAVGVRAINVGRSRALGGEDDPLSIRGERGIVVKARIGEQLALTGAVRVGDKQLGGGGTNAIQINPVGGGQGQQSRERQANELFHKELLATAPYKASDSNRWRRLAF